MALPFHGELLLPETFLEYKLMKLIVLRRHMVMPLRILEYIIQENQCRLSRSLLLVIGFSFPDLKIVGKLPFRVSTINFSWLRAILVISFKKKLHYLRLVALLVLAFCLVQWRWCSCCFGCGGAPPSCRLVHLDAFLRLF